MIVLIILGIIILPLTLIGSYWTLVVIYDCWVELIEYLQDLFKTKHNQT